MIYRHFYLPAFALPSQPCLWYSYCPALKQEQEQARKADLANKRKALYRTPEPQPKTQPEADIQTKAQTELPVDTSIRHRSFGKGSSNLRRS